MSRESSRDRDPEARRQTDVRGSSAPAAAGEQRRTPPTQFLREVRGELRKVAWPSRQEVISYSIVVLVTTLVLVLIVWGMDYVIREAVINTLG